MVKKTPKAAPKESTTKDVPKDAEATITASKKKKFSKQKAKNVANKLKEVNKETNANGDATNCTISEAVKGTAKPVKKKWRGKKKKKDDADKVPVATNIPKASTEVSANWKRLSEMLPKSDRPKKKPRLQNSVSKTATEETPDADIWFDDVDPDLVRSASGLAAKKGPLAADQLADAETVLAPTGDNKEVTKYLAMDCEMVGVGAGGEKSVLARCSIVNYHGHVVYDKYVRPSELVTDFRTHVSGVSARHLRDAIDLKTCQEEVAELTKGRVVIGHALHNDWRALLLDHPRKLQRDTQTYTHFRTVAGTKKPALRVLAQKLLNITVQKGHHSSVEDARTALALYKKHRKEWEEALHPKKATKAKAT
eukprot:Colp12_sorted_trinity150504_noHs@3173